MHVSIEVAPEVTRAHPTLQVRFVVARGLSNGAPWPLTVRQLEELEVAYGAGIWRPREETDSEISSWYDAYRTFGTNPRRSRPSVDALGRRMRRTGALPRVNSAVDSYNFVSAQYGVPAGAYDLDALEGPVRLRPARQGDVFVPLGEPSKPESPQEGEIVYAQQDRVLTRHWNHRDSDLTKVTEGSRNVVFLLERVCADAVSSAKLQQAQEKLAELVAPHSRGVALCVIEQETPITFLADNEPGFFI
jgi:DNA/RNA-binding domain of Phe-tRNA-synthetase-like protein